MKEIAPERYMAYQKSILKRGTAKTFLVTGFSLEANWGGSGCDETTAGATHWPRRFVRLIVQIECRDRQSNTNSSANMFHFSNGSISEQVNSSRQ